MLIESLCILHQPKGETFSFSPPKFNSTDFFFIETCQRYLWICDNKCLAKKNSEYLDLSHQFLYGREAYEFLLKLCCGLESHVLGETDVFGQIKQSWCNFNKSCSPLKTNLLPWINRIFEDTKEIRATQLESLGVSSYGSWVRKKLGPSSKLQNVFIVGAGQLAHSIAPFLSKFNLKIWSRTKANQIKYYEYIKNNVTPDVEMVCDENFDIIWKNSNHIVLCVPVNTKKDPHLVSLWKNKVKEKTSKTPMLIHLGYQDHLNGPWSNLEQCLTLSDLFFDQKNQNSIKKEKVAKALKLCHEKSLLRSMGQSINIPHGWEDLLNFA